MPQIDMERYALDPPAAGAKAPVGMKMCLGHYNYHSEQWKAAVDNAKAQLEHQTLRHTSGCVNLCIIFAGS